jgi:ABC-type molybdenum transport system ATPase subunit/photorepair protein PhrA
MIELEREMCRYTMSCSYIDHPIDINMISVPTVRVDVCRYQDIKSVYSKLNSASREYDTKNAACTKITRDIQVANTLERTIKVYETRLLNTFIREFNHIMSQLLGVFFEDPMNVELYIDIGGGTTEQQRLKMRVMYKGRELKHLKDLSNGEFQRVLLAGQITFMKLLHAPIILMDEITSHLDEDCAMVIYQNVNEWLRSTGTTGCVISHNVISGMFEHIIRL